MFKPETLYITIVYVWTNTNWNWRSRDSDSNWTGQDKLPSQKRSIDKERISPLCNVHGFYLNLFSILPFFSLYISII